MTQPPTVQSAAQVRRRLVRGLHETAMRWLTCNRAQAAVEYCLIASMIALLVAVSARAPGAAINLQVDRIMAALASGPGGPSSVRTLSTEKVAAGGTVSTDSTSLKRGVRSDHRNDASVVYFGEMQ